MSQSVHMIAKNLPGHGPAEGRCLLCSGVCGRAIALCPPSRGDHKICSQVKIGSLKCVSRAASSVCKGTSGGYRRNPDFPRQNKQGFFRNRNRQNEERESFDSLDESDLLTSKNGPLLSLSNTPKFQATAAPGPREREIVELFRKVQAQLRERAAVKEDKNVEGSQGKGKENETVNSLLKLLRKHSVEQGKKKISSFGSGDLISDQNGPYDDKSTNFFNSSIKGKNDVLEPSNSSFNRPPSNFRRKSPVPQVKFQPIYSSEDSVNSMSQLNLSSEKKQQFEMPPNAAQQLDMESEEEPEPDAEPEPDLELQTSFPGVDVFEGQVVAELAESESDVDIVDEYDDRQQLGENEDLSTLKLPELRALAKSRGLKGFSKMKKGDLVELLSGGSVLSS